MGHYLTWEEDQANREGKRDASYGIHRSYEYNCHFGGDVDRAYCEGYSEEERRQQREEKKGKRKKEKEIDKQDMNMKDIYKRNMNKSVMNNKCLSNSSMSMNSNNLNKIKMNVIQMKNQYFLLCRKEQMEVITAYENPTKSKEIG